MAVNIGPKIGVDGEAEYRKQLNNIIQQAKTLSSEMKAVTSSFTSNTSAQEKAASQTQVLTKQIENQKERVSLLAQGLAQATEKWGEADTRTLKWQQALNEATAELNDMENSLDDVGDGLDDAGDSAITFGDLIKANVISDVITAGLEKVADLVKSIGSKLVQVGKDALSSYSDYEQLTGGVAKLFEDAYDTVVANAEAAYKTAGMSANDYMETVTGFAASLISGLGGDTAEAAAIADTAISDMADNANTFGTSMDSIINAYQGFAKQNYTMLDNLKLGYGGTATEMARLINESGVLGDTMTVTADTVNEVSFDKMIEAIHVVQENMGITGTTANEAASTIEGSVNSMKAAWSNLLVAMASDNADLDTYINQFLDSVAVAAKNVGPRIMAIIPNMVSAIRTAIKEAASMLPDVLNEIFADTSLSGVNWEGIIGGFSSFVNLIVQNAPTIISLIGGIAAGFAAWKISSIVQSLGSVITGVLVPALTGGTISMQGLNAAFAANPIGAVITLITALAAGIVALWNTNEGFRDAVSSIWEAIKGFFVGAWEAIKAAWDVAAGYFSAIWAAIDATFSSVVETLRGYFALAWEAIKTVWNAATGFFSNIWNTIKGIFSVVKSVLSGNFQDAWTAIKNVFSGWSSYFSGLWDSITSIFSKAWDFFSGIGEDIVKGIWNGIQNLASWIKEKVSNFFGGIVSSVKSLLGINSPSKVFAEIGENMAAGVGEGWDDEFGDVEKSIGKSFSSVIPGSSEISAGLNAGIQRLRDAAVGTYSGSTMQTAGDNMVTINVYAASNQDEQQIANLILNKLQHQIRQRESVFAQ